MMMPAVLAHACRESVSYACEREEIQESNSGFLAALNGSEQRSCSTFILATLGARQHSCPHQLPPASTSHSPLLLPSAVGSGSGKMGEAERQPPAPDLAERGSSSSWPPGVDVDEGCAAAFPSPVWPWVAPAHPLPPLPGPWTSGT